MLQSHAAFLVPALKSCIFSSERKGVGRSDPAREKASRFLKELPMHYFAYGSNMDWDQMKDRCPDSRFVAIATVEGHKLCFPRLSNRRGCGVASIVAQVGSCVWGVLYNVSAKDLASLDHHEGYEEGREASQNRYNRIKVEVLRDGFSNSPVNTWTYVAVHEQNPPLPSGAYKAHLVAGAAYWGLPPDYQAELRAIAIAQAEPDIRGGAF